jgi:hypothetical protein
LVLVGAFTDNGTLIATGTLTLDNLAGGTGVLEAYGADQITISNGAALKEAIIGAGSITLDQGIYMLNGERVQIGSVDILLTGALSGYGTIAGQLINGGIVEAKGGSLTFESQVDFGPSLAASGLVELATPNAFEGVIAGFGSSDVIDLINTLEASYSYNNNVLTVMNGVQTVASLNFSGTYSQSDFTLAPDGHGGISITYV